MSSKLNPQVSRRDLLRLMGIGAASTLLPAWLASPAFAQTEEVTQEVNTSLSGNVTIWDRAGDLFQVLDAAIPAFNKVYPNIKVNHLAVDTAKLPPTLVSGVNIPDGAFIEDLSLGLIKDNLLDITDKMQPYVNDLVGYKVRVNTFGGQIKGIPYDTDPGMLFYRADLLEAAGIDIASIQTYDDLINAAVTLQSKNPKMKPIHIDTTPGIIVDWVAMMANQQGTSYVDKDGNLLLEQPEFLNIMNFIKSVLDKGVGNLSGFTQPDDIAACDNDIQVFYLNAIWFNYQADALLKTSRGKWRAAKLPKWSANGAQAASMGGSSFVIPAKGANPDLAWAFYQYMMLSLPGLRAAFGPNPIYPGGITTVIPSYKPAYKEHLMKNPDSLGGQDLYTFATGLVDEIPTNYYFPNWYGQLADIIGANVQSLQSGDMSPEDVISQSADAIRSNLMR